MSTPTDADELDLRHYLDVLRRRKVVVIAATVVVVALAMVLTLRQPEQYRAASEVLLRQSTSEQLLTANDLRQNPASAQYRINVFTEIEYMKSRSVRDEVRDALGFVPDVSISPNGETEVVTIKVVHREPQTAARAADVYAQTYIDIRREELVNELLRAQGTIQNQIDTLEAEKLELETELREIIAILNITNDADERARVEERRSQIEEEIAPDQQFLESQLTAARAQLASIELTARITQTGGAQLISAAAVPTAPFSPTPLRNAVVALVVGLLLGVGLAFLFETLDDRVRSKVDLERVTGWSVVGLIPSIDWRDAKRPRLISLEEPKSPAAEAYRTLRTSIQFLGLERPLQVIQVTSASASDGKSTTLSNLGVALARAGNRVIMVDCDLRRPRLGEFFGISSDVGLTSVLLGEAELADAIKPVAIERRLAILPSGPPPPNPSELLALRKTVDLFTALREECDVLLVDSPPVLPVTDAVVLAGQVDGVLVVCNAAKTRSREIQRASELLNQVNAPVIGTVVNGVDTEGGYGYYYGYTYVGPSSRHDEAAERLVATDRTKVPPPEVEPVLAVEVVPVTEAEEPEAGAAPGGGAHARMNGEPTANGTTPAADEIGTSTG